MTGLIDLQYDIGLAQQFRVPVLITAGPDAAFAVALVIAGGRKERGRPIDVAWVDGAAIVTAARRDQPAKDTTDGEKVLVVREVHVLSNAEQAALTLLLDDESARERRRIISTSSVCLYERVTRGTFDARLFYRLNVIHIVSQACGDRPLPARPCCEGADN